jgi:hypothetical protein
MLTKRILVEKLNTSLLALINSGDTVDVQYLNGAFANVDLKGLFQPV